MTSKSVYLYKKFLYHLLELLKSDIMIIGTDLLEYLCDIEFGYWDGKVNAKPYHLCHVQSVKVLYYLLEGSLLLVLQLLPTVEIENGEKHLFSIASYHFYRGHAAYVLLRASLGISTLG